MKQKVSDYIADFFVQHEMNQVFCVVGGGAMHLNDSFGHRKDMHVLYNHHEQASAIAAEAYARVVGKPAVLCVTSGPGAINALNGVVGAYQDSIPMIVVSGQTKSTMTVKSSGLRLRTLGNQEFDIVSALDNMVKYAKMITNPAEIRYCLERAYMTATSGRPGPVWLDIPLDIQGAYIETNELKGYTQQTVASNLTNLEDVIPHILELLNKSERPVLYAGNGIRLSNGVDLLHKLAFKLQVPIVTCWDSIDLIGTDNPLYCGRGGTMGDRAGNFAVQNSDLLITIGTRLNIYQVGYNVKTWARAAKTVVVDIDSEELKKPTIRVDIPVCADAADFMQILYDSVGSPLKHDAWMQQCRSWKQKYPVVRKSQLTAQGMTNVYAFMDTLSHRLPLHAISVVTNGSASVVGSQSYYIKDGDRFIMNCGLSSMGYGLPAAIGACLGNQRNSVVCIEGDGSIMMNLQELQTMVTNKLPIKLFIINNNGYHQIRQTQNNIFHNGLVGVGPDSGDLSFPEFSKIASAFGIRYVSIHDNQKISDEIQSVFNDNSPCLCEVFVTTDQKFEPKSSTKKLPDGTLVSPPLEDLAPFLPREELAQNMYIPLVPES